MRLSTGNSVDIAGFSSIGTSMCIVQRPVAILQAVATIFQIIFATFALVCIEISLVPGEILCTLYKIDLLLGFHFTASCYTVDVYSSVKQRDCFLFLIELDLALC